MTPIKRLPELDWTDLAAEHIKMTGAEIVEQSHCAYQIGNIAVAGLIYDNFLRPPWFWFALAKGASIADLLDFKRLIRFIPIGAQTAVDADNEVTLRFASVFGFADSGESFTVDDKTYKIFRRV